MTVVIKGSGLRSLLFGGASLIAYCASIVLDARAFQVRENRLLNRLLEVKESAPLVPSNPNSLPPAPIPVAVSEGSPIGRIEIPHLGVAAVVIEGSDQAVLRRAVGHIPGTALPGQTGNTALTGQRDTFFRPLRNIRRDNPIRLTTLQGEYEYRVGSTRIVDPDDVKVLDSDGGEALTLITCYPFYFVGAAPRRFVVRAERVAPRLTQTVLALPDR